MYRNDSEAARERARGVEADRGAAGFTLIETLIAMVASVIIGIGVVRFYKDSYHAYSMQDQVQDRDQNAHFAVTRFTEIMQQAGSGLPDIGWPMITQTTVAPIVTTVAVNPRNAIQFVGTDSPNSQFIPISDATQWKSTANVMLNIAHVLIDYTDPAKPIIERDIDTSYTQNGYQKGIKDMPAGMDTLRITNAVDLSVGDRVYGYREDQYLLAGSSKTDLVLRPDGNTAAQMVLAENIDSLVFDFKDAAGKSTPTWSLMRSAQITVRARTAMSDPRLKGGYRRITLPMNVILRNRL
jgi:Tfp pilus assembly protein PilW